MLNFKPLMRDMATDADYFLPALCLTPITIVGTTALSSKQVAAWQGKTVFTAYNCKGQTQVVWVSSKGFKRVEVLDA